MKPTQLTPLLAAALLALSPTAAAAATNDDDSPFYIVRKPLPQSEAGARQLTTATYPDLSFEEAVTAIRGVVADAASSSSASAANATADGTGVVQRVTGGGSQWGCVTRGGFQYCGGKSGWSAAARPAVPGWLVVGAGSAAVAVAVALS